MTTFVSILTWQPDARCSPDRVRQRVRDDAAALRRGGLHSFALLPDADGSCSAVIVASCDGEAELSTLAREIVPAPDVRTETMRFDEPVKQAPRGRRPAGPGVDYRIPLLRALRASPA
jgi:hypothetical protein